MAEKPISKIIPMDQEQFKALMEEIDTELAGEGYTIPQRPLNAICKAGKKLLIPIPLSPASPGMPPEVALHWPLTEKILDWYNRRYEDHLKMEHGPGRMAIYIGHDVWILSFPLIYGLFTITSSRIKKTKSRIEKFSGKPLELNVVDCVLDLPDGLRESLTDEQLSNIHKYFRLGFFPMRKLQDLSGEELIKFALADISSAIDHLTRQTPDYGSSKWASLQASEKIIKASIKKIGSNPSRIHKLRELVREASRAGLTLDINEQIAKIQCSPGIRYGDESCSKEDAIAAHHAVFVLAQKVTEALKELEN